MELRQLRYFAAVCEEGSITRAAQVLNIVQPAVSRQIGELEAELGYPLLERLPSGVQLTKAGRAFLDDVHRILADLKEAKSRAAMVAAGHLVHVRVGVVGAENMPKLQLILRGLKSYFRLYPGGTIKLRSHNTWESMNRSINEGELDVAFTYGGVSFRDHRSIPIQRECLVLAVPAGHRLARLPKVSVADLQGENLVWHARSAAGRMHDYLMDCFRNSGIEPNIVFELENPSLATAIVRSGLGCAFVSSAVSSDDEADGIVLRRLGDVNFEVELQLAWSGQSAAAEKFVEVYKDLIGENPPFLANISTLDVEKVS
jgi:DNA-binding transcriptional LysR family regulator